MPRFVFLILLSVALSGCTLFGENTRAPAATALIEADTTPRNEPDAAAIAEEKAALRKLEQELAQGIRAYENGRYRDAQQNLKTALDGGLISNSDQLTAHKYLAFITCANRQREACKGHFRKALAINPEFTLTATEAGHPMWRTAFKEVRAESQKSGR